MQKLANWFEKMVPDAKDVLRRFPLAVLMMVALTILIMIEVRDFKMSDDIFWKLSGGVVLAGYLSIILTLIGEGRGKTVSPIVKAIVCGTAIVAAYFFRSVNFSWYTAIGAAVLFLGSAPFWRQKRNDVAVWDFSHKIWTGVIFTTVGSMIYMAGVFSIAFALNSLFGVKIDDLVQEWLIPIGFGFLAPVAWMAMVPAHDEDDGDSLRNPGFISRAIGFLGTWVLTPLTFIYALILLAYIVKIMATRSLPNGEIGNLVSPFLVIGTLTWLILDPPFIQAKRLARWFHKLWFPLMIPMAALLAIAVFMRVSEYGWTEERYLLVLMAVWALGIALWYTFRSEAKRDIRIIPGFAALLLVFGSIGPWGANGVSTISQSARLTQGLEMNAMLDADGYLKPTDMLVLENKDAAIQAKSAMEYLLPHGKTNRINLYFETPFAEAFFNVEDYTERNDERKKVVERFGLTHVKVPSRYSVNSPLGNSSDYKPKSTIIPVTDYDHVLVGRNIYFRPSNAAKKPSFSIAAYEIWEDKGDIVVKHEQVEISRISMLSNMEKQRTDALGNLDIDPYVVLYSRGDKEISLYLTGGNVTTYETESTTGRIHFTVLLKNIDIENP